MTSVSTVSCPPSNIQAFFVFLIAALLELRVSSETNGVPYKYGVPFGGLHDKDQSILESILWPPYIWKLSNSARPSAAPQANVAKRGSVFQILSLQRSCKFEPWQVPRASEFSTGLGLQPALTSSQQIHHPDASPSLRPSVFKQGTNIGRKNNYCLSSQMTSPGCGVLAIHDSRQ